MGLSPLKLDELATDGDKRDLLTVSQEVLEVDEERKREGKLPLLRLHDLASQVALDGREEVVRDDLREGGEGGGEVDLHGRPPVVVTRTLDRVCGLTPARAGAHHQWLLQACLRRGLVGAVPFLLW